MQRRKMLVVRSKKKPRGKIPYIANLSPPKKALFLAALKKTEWI
jgi:hypothetical protein